MPDVRKLARKIRAEVGVSNRDERLTSLAKSEASQVNGAILSHHVMHVATGRNDARARRQLGGNARDLSARHSKT